jgi:formylglycine-generating enzyme required for sulfatase activity
MFLSIAVIMRATMLRFLILLAAAWQIRPIEFVSIPAGEFMMGCAAGDSDCRDSEKPAHLVRISRPFQISRFEITQGQWLDVMEKNPSEYEGDNLPVHNISFENIQEFLARMNVRGDGFRYRLPTEAEWEYAARAGKTSAYGGTLDAMAWHDGNAKHEPHAVGTKQGNAWGLHDVSGNVWEWVSDWYDERFYAASSLMDPAGPPEGRQHVVRGGSFSDSAAFARLSSRLGVTPSFGNYDLGFRCVREPTEEDFGPPPAAPRFR